MLYRARSACLVGSEIGALPLNLAKVSDYFPFLISHAVVLSTCQSYKYCVLYVLLSYLEADYAVGYNFEEYSPTMFREQCFVQLASTSLHLAADCRSRSVCKLPFFVCWYSSGGLAVSQHPTKFAFRAIADRPRCCLCTLAMNTGGVTDGCHGRGLFFLVIFSLSNVNVAGCKDSPSASCLGGMRGFLWVFAS